MCQNGPKNTDNSQLTATILWKTLRLLLLVAVGPSVSAFGLLDSGLFNIFKVKFVFQVFQNSTICIFNSIFVFSGLNFVIQSLGFCYNVSPMFHIHVLSSIPFICCLCFGVSFLSPCLLLPDSTVKFMCLSLSLTVYLLPFLF